MRSPSMPDAGSNRLKFPSRSRRLELEPLECRQLLAGVVAEYPTPSLNGFHDGIMAGPDGALWFTGIDNIGRITTSGAVTEFALPTLSSGPYDITTGPDGALWFTEGPGGKIGRITTGGALTEIRVLPSSPGISSSSTGGITSGSDGNLWYTYGSSRLTAPYHTATDYGIGRITPVGVDTQFSLGNSMIPGGITSGPDGNLWFTESLGKTIGRFTTTGVVTQFRLLTPNAMAGDITTGPDGALWFTELIFLFNEKVVSKVGRITTDGVVTEFPIPTTDSVTVGITAGPDGNLWFTEGYINKIGQLSPKESTQTQLTALPNPPLVGQTLTFTAVITSGPGTVIPTGDVTFSIDGTAAATVPLTPVDGKRQASLTLTTLSVGPHTVTASYGGSPTHDASSASQAVTVISPPTIISPPTVNLVERFGFHIEPTRIVLSFSTTLDPTRAEDVHNYKIVGPGGRTIAVDRAVYSPLSNTVVLTPHSRLDIHRIYRLTVNGTSPSGVTDTFGTSLDGAGNGQPGSNFVTNLTAANLVLGTQVPGGPARLAHLRAIVARIEANQSRQLARLHHASTSTRPALRK